MDSRFSSDPTRRAALSSFPALLALLACLGLFLAGCGRHAVRASEKEFLADHVMLFDSDPQEASTDEHILTNREGSTGGRGTAGGGCGCN